MKDTLHKVTDKLKSTFLNIFEAGLDKLSDKFEDMDNRKQMLVWYCFMFIVVTVILPAASVISVIRNRSFKYAIAGWKSIPEHIREFYQEIKEDQKHNTKLHRVLK